MTAAASFDVVDAAVEWNLKWANRPRLAVLLAREPLPRWADREWHPFDLGRGTLFVSRHEPTVEFFYEDATNHRGAYRGVVRLAGGGEYKALGAWSSSAAAVNRARNTNPDVAALLPHDLVEVTYHVEEWDRVGIAGVTVELPYAHDLVRRFCPGVVLRAHAAYADSQASSEQAQVINAGLPLPDEKRGAHWCPATPGAEKPHEASHVYQQTAYELKRQRARAEARR